MGRWASWEIRHLLGMRKGPGSEIRGMEWRSGGESAAKFQTSLKQMKAQLWGRECSSRDFPLTGLCTSPYMDFSVRGRKSGPDKTGFRFN